MSFTSEQTEALRAPLDRQHVQSREQSGRTVFYITGWHAIAEANQVFGFDAWDRETVYCREVCRYEQAIGRDKVPGWKVGYEAKVLIKVGDVIREGTGHGSGIARDLFDAIESAAKEAETDAMKRALMTFGNRFGLALYDKEQRNVANVPQASEINEADEYVAKAQSTIQALGNKGALETWWNNGKVKRREAGLSQQQCDQLKAAVQARVAAVAPQAAPSQPVKPAPEAVAA